ncbi:MAG: BamA/TamA family outer membrane protein [Armatimonadota bacterium]|nr:BamA/TamA family outer membrane protein [Armatimonadota bacterium]MDR7465127.1 BamA/TamA family outer membrane protein [Armatimonadota bacterium]MDR7470245.1 BamA/TamA family outer membrane protein [Armatimonadota bacterium]MDR7473402.1 BamA/TamA family outer membrane protein [Armatimonadota bacterium]
MAAVEVVGNRYIPTAQILAVVTIKVGDVPTPEQLRRDVQAIADLGWFADVSVRVETDPAGLRVVFLVVENPRVVAVVVQGNTVVATADIVRALDIPMGEVLNTKRARDGVRAVEKLYEERGYVLVRVVDIGLDPADDGRLRVRLAEGRVEDVVFRGLTKTRPAVARRYVRLQRGDVFNVRQMNADLQRLFETGLFESVQARPQPGSTPEAAVIEIEVKEARTGELSFGAGYSTTEGLTGQIAYRERNWRGRAQTVALRAERGFSPTATQAAKFTFVLSFREPFLDPHQTSLDLNLYQTVATQTEVSGGATTARFDLERVGSLAEVMRPMDAHTTVSLRLRSERAAITPLPIDPSGTCPPDPCAPPAFFSPGRTVSVTVSGSRDLRDSRINPTRGSRQMLSLEFALPPLGSEFNFQKYFAEYVQYIPLGGESLIAGRVGAGLGSGAIPGQELFALGGPTTLRGFSGGQYRGTAMALANVEYRAPLGGIAPFFKDFTGIVFVDGGAAWGTALSTPGFVANYGVGVAFRSPLGVLRLDFAFGPAGTQTWLNLGHPF